MVCHFLIQARYLLNSSCVVVEYVVSIMTEKMGLFLVRICCHDSASVYVLAICVIYGSLIYNVN